MRKTFQIIITFIITGCATAPHPIFPIPEKKQTEWQKMETNAFIHFGPNTFMDKEWGYGDADPKVFNPSDLDCEQWVKTLKNAGMKGIILTAKHHDGFCLWQTKYTDFSVKQSPWKNGKGDVVRELSEACKKHGMKFAVYLSPWDRHQASYGTKEYVEYFHNQLKELLTNYGDVFEIWFDGANGGDGWYGGADEKRTIDRKNYYDYPSIYKIIDKTQPNAIIFSDSGPGCRWVGNEKGFAGETNWSLLKKGVIYPGCPNHKELTTGHEDGNQWVPAECDVSIRPGWFYHEKENDKVRSVENLIDLYYSSVGRNGTLLLNFPVDKRGKIPASDSIAITEWRKRLDEEFKTNILSNSKVTSSNERGRKFSASKVKDGKYDTYWSTEDNVTSGFITFEFDHETRLNRLLLQEYIPLGQRVRKFNVEFLKDGKWTVLPLKEATTTIGYKRLLRFDDIVTKGIRINILESKGPVTINNIEGYCAPAIRKDHKKIQIPSGIPFAIEGMETKSITDNNLSTCATTSKKELVIDLKENKKVKELLYYPDSSAKGLIYKYELYGADELKNNVVLLSKGEFSNIKNNPVMQSISFDETTCRYLLLKAVQVVDEEEFISISELRVL